MSNEDGEKRRGPFEKFCWIASEICFIFTAWLACGGFAMWTVALWAGADGGWVVSDTIVWHLLWAIYLAIPMAMYWYATKEGKCDE